MVFVHFKIHETKNHNKKYFTITEHTGWLNSNYYLLLNLSCPATKFIALFWIFHVFINVGFYNPFSFMCVFKILQLTIIYAQLKSIVSKKCDV